MREVIVIAGCSSIRCLDDVVLYNVCILHPTQCIPIGPLGGVPHTQVIQVLLSVSRYSMSRFSRSVGLSGIEPSLFFSTDFL